MMQIEYENEHKRVCCCSDVSQAEYQYFRGFREISMEL